MNTDHPRKPFWIFLFCAFMQVILFLFIYSIGWSIIEHYYHPSNRFDWGLTFLLAIYAFFIATSVQWLLLFFTKGKYLIAISAIVFITLAIFIYTSYYPWRSLFLLGCLFSAQATSNLVFRRLSKRVLASTAKKNNSASNLLDDDWE
ncbi:hypothetical protein [Lewinella cohaerens]|uniref:hypothetical protein n=1 Tax=Lewinella cohaerens TaxID=70995 RepID=UPI0003809776|nr:hypothetical protein [Lewinella cohaerens]